MATIKSYTDIEQSKKLAEILPLESADYFHAPDAGIVVTEPYKLNEDDETVITAYKGAIPCWSLAALINIIPQELFDGEYIINITEGLDSKWVISYDADNSNSLYGLIANADNLVDACTDIIIKLKERNII